MRETKKTKRIEQLREQLKASREREKVLRNHIQELDQILCAANSEIGALRFEISVLKHPEWAKRDGYIK